MDAYTALIFKNHEEFEMYNKTTNLNSVRVALSEDYEIVVFIRTQVPIPTGLLTVKTSKDREIVIRIKSGFTKIEDSEDQYKEFYS
jgi:hypothetical protein